MPAATDIPTVVKMKIKDGIVGLVVGDALGVPVEFKSRSELLENPVTGMTGHGTYDLPKGTWSDDTSLTLATMQSIVSCNGIDHDDLLCEFSLFVREGKYAQYHTFSYGNTTAAAVDRFESGVDALKCGGTSEEETTNGSLMRILPLAFVEGVGFSDVEDASAITHAHERCRIACALYVEIAKSMINENLEISEHIENACGKIRKHYAESAELNYFERIFENDLGDVESGFLVVETLECAIHCLLSTSNYREAVLKAVNMGNDADTVAAVCGGLAGIYYGFDEIPSEWIEDIPQIGDVIELCSQFEDLKPVVKNVR
jgi:ADP-ribosylglycohydrolase